MDGKSLNITEEKLSKLKRIIPEAFSENKIDWEKLKAALGNDIEFKNERYVLNWAGKSDAFRVLQSPTTATLVPAKEESVNFDTTEKNLEVLKVLQKAYFGKIKMIYIDPPYNTGNDNFIYPDKFSESREEYLSRIGDKDETGYLTREGLFRKNSKDSGHYHSNWLSMMYPRLFLARNLLRDDGVIFVSIDDNEVHNLRLLMNEVFGEENFIAEFIWKSRQNVDSRSLNGASNDHEYIICFSKLEGKIRGKEIDKSKYSNPDNDTRGAWMSSPIDGIATKDKRPNLHYTITNPQTNLEYEPSPENGWRFQKLTIKKLIEENRIIWPKNPKSKPRFKRYLNELNNDFTGFSSVLQTVFTTQGTRELREFMGTETLKFPKPSKLIKTTIEQGTKVDKGDIILDFFSGSATTAHAVLDLNKEDTSTSSAQAGNRKFILVQLPEKTDEKSETYKAGYKTIAEIGKERIRRVIKKIKKEQGEKLDLDGNSEKLDLGFKIFKLHESNFKIWRTKIETEEELVEQLEQHLEPLDENAKTEDVLYELLLKSGVSLTANIKEKNEVYFVNDNEIALLLKKVNEKIIKLVIKQDPKKVITLDRLFNNNDQLKTNTALQMKDAGIEFKVV